MVLKIPHKENYDMCLLLIRWKHVLWGYRTPLELGDLGQCEDFMAHQAVQDLLDKVWFGGVEPFASLFKVCLMHKLWSMANLLWLTWCFQILLLLWLRLAVYM